jgi:hypothetical protein
MRSAPLGDRQQTPSTAQHAATQKREHRRQGVAPTGGASMIRHDNQGSQ